MTATPRILVFAGSAREGSFNKKLARVAAAAAKAAGAEVTFIDLRDLPMPIFDEDLETRDGEHPHAKAFKDHMKAHDGFIIVSPENNSTYSALLKNVLDWASRRRPGEARFECFADKVTLIMSASPGPAGGLRGLLNLRALLANLSMIVLPDQLTLPSADKAFNEDGTLKDPAVQSTVEKLTGKIVGFIRKLKA